MTSIKPASSRRPGSAISSKSVEISNKTSIHESEVYNFAGDGIVNGESSEIQTPTTVDSISYVGEIVNNLDTNKNPEEISIKVQTSTPKRTETLLGAFEQSANAYPAHHQMIIFTNL